jgi:alpha-beta hydrolase superfamily lysophospholipase
MAPFIHQLHYKPKKINRLISGPDDPRYFDLSRFPVPKPGQHWTDARREQLAAFQARVRQCHIKDNSPRTNCRVIAPHLIRQGGPAAFPGLIPLKPYCADYFEEGLRIRSKGTALKRRHVQFNRPNSYDWLSFDVDRDEAYRAAEDANLPAPTIISANPENGHALLSYLLDVPVHRFPSSSRRPIDYLADVQRGYTRRLEADRSFNGIVPHELSAKEIETADWAEYLKTEAGIFDEVRGEVTRKLPPEERVPYSRYFEGSTVYPGHFSQDWNRSYALDPNGSPVGAVVLLHGLTDSPYTLRHIAEIYRSRGFVVIAIRLPGHGTVPAGLTDIKWESWKAATRLAVREACRRIPESAPLHLVGFSLGGALALQYALDAITDREFKRPDRLVLITPMIGINRLARFAGLAGLPAFFPAFAKAAWLSVLPEFNPFKYNSFPVNGARQSARLADALQDQISHYAREGKLASLPPTLTFQSVVDFTVSTPAIMRSFYARLPQNGSEVVLFDVNRSIKLGPLLRSSADIALTRILPTGPQKYRTTIITNADAGNSGALEGTIEVGAVTAHSREVGLSYPADVFSLSHLALPFPMNDSLYGRYPDPAEDFGIHLGTLAPRGERNVLIASMDMLLRLSFNPFFPYMKERIEEGIRGHAAAGPGNATETARPLVPETANKAPTPNPAN